MHTGKSLTSLRLDNLSMINGFHNIALGANILYLQVQTASGAWTPFQVTIPVGVYTFTTFKVALEAALTGVVADGATLTTNETTLSATLAFTGENVAGAFIRFLSLSEIRALTNHTRSLNEVLGVAFESTDVVATIGAHEFSAGMFNISGPKFAVITSSDLAPAVGALGMTGSLDALCVIPITVGPGEALHYSAVTAGAGLHYPSHDGTLSELHFRVQDEFGSELSMPDNCDLVMNFTFIFQHK